MASIAARLSGAWYSGARWPVLLTPLEWLYRGLTAIQRHRYRLGFAQQNRFPVPVVVVGNITVGGTGKTPLVVALVKQLTAMGYHPGVVSRGYGSAAPSYPFAVTASGEARHCGDEPLLIAIRTSAPVVIDADRSRAVRYLLANYHCDLVITDDGLQHYKLARDIECVVVDGQRKLGNGRCLPRGPLREPPGRLHSVDFIVVNGGTQQPAIERQSEPADSRDILAATATTKASEITDSTEPAAAQLAALRTTTPQSQMVLQNHFAHRLDDSETIALADWDASDRRVHAVAGIGNPGRFFSALRQHGFSPIEHSFDDHYQFSLDDLDFADGLPVLMTEKDAVKVRAQGPLNNAWYVPVEAVLDTGFVAALSAKLEKIVANNRAGFGTDIAG